MSPVPLREVADLARFGGKAVALGHALRHGLPVPNGVALSTDFVDATASGDATAHAQLHDIALHRPVAVRSSAIGEDGAAASFAGQHLSVLHVRTHAHLTHAVREVHASGTAAAAIAYRAHLGVGGPPRMAVVVQEMVAADRAGVLFTRHPVTGKDECVIESTWGLGEAVVNGRVTPDSYRVARDGRVLEQRAGYKDVAIRPAEHGTAEVPVPDALIGAHSLEASHLARLTALARQCEALLGAPADLEWAFEGDTLWLLQQRPITKTRTR